MFEVFDPFNNQMFLLNYNMLFTQILIQFCDLTNYPPPGHGLQVQPDLMKINCYSTEFLYLPQPVVAVHKFS